jgi:hypothetical protein
MNNPVAVDQVERDLSRLASGVDSLNGRPAGFIRVS